MKKYLVIYHAPPQVMATMATATPEQKEAGMKPWMAWMGKVGEHLKDPGSPFHPGVRITPDGASTPSTKEVSGYSIIEANDLEHAKSMVQDHPHLAWADGCALEIFEAMPLGM